MPPTPQTDAAARPARIPWPPILFAAAILGAWAAGRAYPLSWPGLDDAPARIIGLGVGLAGAALLAWGTITLWKAGTTVLPDKAATRLVTNGPFAFRRNPIYLAEVLMLFGAAELTKNVWFAGAAALFAMLVTWLAILPEERHLEAVFGQAYLDYKARVRRLI